MNASPTCYDSSFAKVFVVCLCLASGCLLTNCVTDRGFDALAAKVEKSPSQDLIVGMWHRKDNLVVDSWLTMVFNADGTGLWRGVYVDENVQTGFMTFTWSYDGGGVWTAVYSNKILGHNKFRIAEGKLLQYTPPSLGAIPSKAIFERVR